MEKEFTSYSLIPKLSGKDNYVDWEFEVEVYMEAQGIYDVVMGKKVKPEPGDGETSKQVEDWMKKDACGRRLIIATLEPAVKMHVRTGMTSAAQMWSKLKELFGDGIDSENKLIREFYNLKYVRGTPIMEHVSKMQSVYSRLQVLNPEYKEERLVDQIVDTLPESYSGFVEAWDNNPRKEKTLSHLIERLQLSEQRKKVKGEDTGNNVAFAAGSSRSTPKCFRCKKEGHLKRDCVEKRVDLECYRCNKKGHTSIICDEELKICSICDQGKHLEKNCPLKKKNGHNESASVCFFLNNESNFYVNGREDWNEWILDSGSSSHMTNCKQLFKSSKDTSLQVNVAKKGSGLEVTHVGEIETNEVVLSQVLYSPELCKNLMSVNAIVKNDGEVLFSKHGVKVYKDGRTILQGVRESNGLFKVNLNAQLTPESHFVKENSAVQWHRKMGHLSFESLKKLKNMSVGLNFSEKELAEVTQNCEICLKANQRRKPFNTVRTKAERPFELIHVDLCGPISPPTWDGKNYFLIFVDDFTNFVQIALLKCKSDAFEHIKILVAESEAKWNTKLTKIRSDKGGEFISNEFKIWCKEKGIQLDSGIAHSPALNGKAERFNGILMAKARSLLFDSELPKTMWGEAARVAAFLMNRSPKTNMGITPFEAWNKRKPDLNRVQIFGSTAYAKKLGYLKKLEERSEKLVFVGYTLTGYRLWDEGRRKIIEARDVVFTPPQILKRSPEILIPLCNLNSDSDEDNEFFDENLASWDNEKSLHSANESHERNGMESDNSEQNVEVGGEVTEHATAGSGTADSDDGMSLENEIEDLEKNDNVLAGNESEVIVDDGENRYPERMRFAPARYPDPDNTAMIADLFHEPRSFREALSSSESEDWKQAIADELTSLKKNDTWTVVDRREVGDKKVLSNRWVFAKKEGGLFKARLVVRGFEQQEGMDYTDTFSPVIGNAVMRIIFALAASDDYFVFKFDVKTAFLHGLLDENVFMYLPEGIKCAENADKICKLNKSLYGLKQASNKWNERFTSSIQLKGFVHVKGERCVFTDENSQTILALHVDDGYIISKCKNAATSLLEHLESEFEIKKIENPETFLGLELFRQGGEFKITQTEYTKKILSKFGMAEANPVSTPMAIKPETELLANNTAEIICNIKNYPYREAVGSLLYLASRTRPDISYSVSYASRKMDKPTPEDILTVKRIFRYLRKDIGMTGIGYTASNDFTLTAYCDSDFAGDLTDRKSTSGFVIFFKNGPISWCSRKQSVVSLSTCESEFISAAECVKELLYFKAVLQDLLGETVKIKLYLFEDNKGTIDLMKNGIFNRRSRHIDVRYHFLHEVIKEGLITVQHVSSDLQIADIFTKPLSRQKFEFFRSKLLT